MILPRKSYGSSTWLGTTTACAGISLSAKDVRPLKVESDGHHSWTEEEIAQCRNTHPIGSRARLALELLLNTGQRGRSDVIRMGRQHIEDGMIRVRQSKTGAELFFPSPPSWQKQSARSLRG